jgi:hypothetical protein
MGRHSIRIGGGWGSKWVAFCGLHCMVYERVHIDMLVETDLFGLK